MAHHRIAVSLGSNVQPLWRRLCVLEEAVRIVGRRIGAALATSGLFETATAYVDNPAPPTAAGPTTATTIAAAAAAAGCSANENVRPQKERHPATPTPPHLNAVVMINTPMACPFAVMSELLTIEKQLGRVRENQHASSLEDNAVPCPALGGKVLQKVRPIDLDLLLYDDLVVAEEKGGVALELPHPRLIDRNFVLFPLADVAPNIRIPGKGLQQVPQFWMARNLAQGTANTSALWGVPLRVFAARSDVLWPFGPGQLPKIMGILNITPDSFSDGGAYMDVEAACRCAEDMVNDGVDIIDVGGESTAPGRHEISADVEIARVVPVIRAIRAISKTIPISIDTRKARVLRAAVEAGADLLNDVSGGAFDAEMLPTAAELGVPLILGHMRGIPETMKSYASYEDVVAEVTTELNTRIEAALAVGIPRWRIMADVGIGFAKASEHNFELLRHLDQVAGRLPHGIAQCVGLSRKRFLGPIVQRAISLKASPPKLLTPEQVRYRDTVGTQLACCIAQRQVAEAQTQPLPWHATNTGSCVALIRTHAVRDVRLGLEALRTFSFACD